MGIGMGWVMGGGDNMLQFFWGEMRCDDGIILFFLRFVRSEDC